jgi:hypothetical protein
MNKRVVCGILISGGLGVGLFAAAERLMRGAGQTEVKTVEPPSEPESPVELVTVPPPKTVAKEPERAPQGPAPAVATSPATPPSNDLARWEEPRPLAATVVSKPVKGGTAIERLCVCLGVKDRNPVGETASVPSDVGKAYCWMRVVNANGKKVRAVWTLDEKRYPGAWLTIGSNSFRTWTTKRLDASCVGPARVEIEDEKGRVVASKDFSVVRR